MSENQFVIHRLRSKPVEYTVRLRHFVSGGEWMLGVNVEDVVEDEVNKDRVADDLRAAADMLAPSREVNLWEALAQAVGWIEECGSAHDGREFVLTEARAALKGFSIVDGQSENGK